MFPLVQERLQRFEERLRAVLRSEVAFIEAIGEELVEAGGKRLRPTLAFLAADVLAADDEAGMRVALAVELLHAASLLHDDLIDDAETRRGSVAAFRRYGNVVSVMSGDFMLARVLGLLAESGSAEFTAMMSRTAAQICEGEVLQFQAATLESYSMEGYRRVIDGKTAVLLATSLEAPALLSGASEAKRSALRTFGMAFGRAFQMQDDRLDLLGDPQQLGKPIGGDLREGKATLPTLLLLEAGVEGVRAVLSRHARNDGDVQAVLGWVREHKIDAKAGAVIRAEAERAISALDVFPPSPARDALISLAAREIDRVR